MERIFVLCTGFFLDLLFGDPYWLWHPVRGIGTCITWTERCLRNVFHIHKEREQDKRKKIIAGAILAAVVIGISVGVPCALLFFAGKIHPWLKVGIECIMCYQILAMKSLKTESMKVYDALKDQDVEQARLAVSMIVGRDTQSLTEEGITKAAVETVAENTSDGVIAPLIFLFLFGIPGGFLYKAVNTMDSMIGYKNDAYYYFGRAAAKLDDLFNFLPSRISALFMILCAFLLRMDGKNAIRIFRRDRFCHASPNSAQTEAVCAGALSIQLAGNAYYFGQLYQKPTIGDAIRPIEPEDIKRANQLMYGTAILTLMTGVLLLL
jgi:adenosylcobinamide-phosphate synthase